jgi:hypothetical protein
VVSLVVVHDFLVVFCHILHLLMFRCVLWCSAFCWTLSLPAL